MVPKARHGPADSRAITLAIHRRYFRQGKLSAGRRGISGVAWVTLVHQRGVDPIGRFRAEPLDGIGCLRRPA